jgi:RimJ/RimL family protein N-acetyltransferase
MACGVSRVVVVETPRLVLRRLSMDDLDDMVALDSDPEVMRYVTGGAGTSREDMRDDLLPHLMRYDERPGGYGFLAAEDHAGTFLGWFHLRPPPGSPPDEAELGYRLNRAAWGRGYATEGARALVDRAFRDLGARRVWASAMAVNTGSVRVMEKCGMRLVRRFAFSGEPIPGAEEGDVEYAITREEWERAAG